MAADIPTVETVRRKLVAEPGKPFALADRPTRDDSLFADKDGALEAARQDGHVIDDLQNRLYAEKTRALLVVLQGMDTAGKSGTIKTVFRYTSPLGMHVTSFKAPTMHELARDYLWRIHAAMPKRGHIGIFDRSHYEDVLVARVRRLAPAEEIERRYEQINAFEKHLVDNGIVLLKCMLHVSKDEQRERLEARLEKPHKRWKYNAGDLKDRALWDEFMEAYGLAVSRCSTPHAPWYVVPADSKPRRNAMVARLVRGILEEMNPDYPEPELAPGSFRIV